MYATIEVLTYFFFYLLWIGLHNEYILFRKYGRPIPVIFRLETFSPVKYNIYTGKTNDSREK